MDVLVVVLLQLKSGVTKVVVCSDAAARGVDIPILSAVVQVLDNNCANRLFACFLHAHYVFMLNIL